MNKILINLSLLLILFFNQFCFTQNNSLDENTLHALIARASNKSLDLRARLNANDSIVAISNNDSLKNFTLTKYVYLHYKLKDSLLFQQRANEHMNYSRKLNNRKALAKTLEYKSAFYNRYHKLDSTFFYYRESFKVYENLNDSLGAGKMLLNIAILQKNIRDYAGSEVTSLRALDFLKPTNNKRRISSVYNNLGILYMRLGRYENSIDFHKKTKKMRSEINSNPIYEIQSLNNIGNTYLAQKDFSKAIDYFTQASKNDSLINKYPKIKSAIASNLAYAQFKQGTKNTKILYDLIYFLNVQDSLGDTYGTLKSTLYVAEFYKSIDSLDQAIKYTQQAEQTAEQIERNQEYLDALELISELYEGQDAKDKFKLYISTRDSLDSQMYKQKEQFANVELSLKEKDSQIKKQKQKNLTIKRVIMILIILVILICVISYWILKRGKKEKQSLDELLHETKTVLEDKQSQLDSLKTYGIEKHDEEYLKELQQTLKTKYKLNNQNLEFWNIFIKDISQKEQAERLCITIDTVIKRRKSLKAKIHKKRPINEAFTAKLARRIYQDEEELFKNTHRVKK